MLINEAQFIGNVLSKISVEKLSPLVNIGAGSMNNSLLQPWIDEYIVNPLKNRGVAIVNHDMQHSPNISLVADISSNKFRSEIKRIKPKAIILANVLEHINKLQDLALKIESCLEKGCYLVVSCPREYPYHPDPIDNGFRPTIKELVQLFPNCKLVDSSNIHDKTYWQYISRNPLITLGVILRLFIPFYKPYGWFSSVGHLTWLNKPFKASVVILKKM